MRCWVSLPQPNLQSNQQTTNNKQQITNNKEISGDLVKILLEALDLDFESLGSTTFKNQRMNQAVEPDACFYIKNYRAVIGKNRLNLELDPPPDLAIEIDITSRTKLDNYRVPWS